MTLNGQRMSKTLGTVVDPVEAADAVRARSAPAVPHEGDRVRRRRRLLVGAVRRALQRRPREQPRQSGEPRDGDGASVSAGQPGARDGSASDQLVRLGEQVVQRLPARDGRARAARGRGGGLPPDRRDQRVHRRDGAVGAGEGSSDRPTGLRRCCSTRRKPSASRRCCCRPFMPASSREILRRVGASAEDAAISIATAIGAPKASGRSRSTDRSGRVRSRRP